MIAPCKLIMLRSFVAVIAFAIAAPCLAETETPAVSEISSNKYSSTTFGGITVYERKRSVLERIVAQDFSGLATPSLNEQQAAPTTRRPFQTPSGLTVKEGMQLTQRGLRGDYSLTPRITEAANIVNELASRAPAASYLVTSSLDLSDSDIMDNIYSPQTLRSAIENANKTGAMDNITFAVSSVSLSTPVVSLHPITIDGAISGGAKVVIDGGFVSPGGVWCQGGGNVIKNLKLTRIGVSSAISLLANSGNPSTVQGCEVYNCFGTGINLNTSSFNIIGGLAAGERNILYGPIGYGIGLLIGSHNNTIIGNYLGTPDGMTASTGTGIGINDEGDHNYIAHNVISGNPEAGITRDEDFINGQDDSAKGQVVEFNMIGVTADGLAKLSNGPNQVGNGYASIGWVSDDTIRHNVISGNGRNGIECQSINSIIEFNICGLDINTEQAIANEYAGIASTRAMLIQNNTVSGNTGGVSLEGPATLRNNIIGKDALAKVSVGNLFYGVSVSGNGAIVGGPNPADRNIVCGNGSDGIRVNGVTTKNVVVQNNYVGVDASGITAIPNGGSGIFIMNGADSSRVFSNVVCANARHGIHISGLVIGATTYWAEGNRIYMNRIGVAADGTTQLANGWNGISAFASRGADFGKPDSGNTIAVTSDSSGMVLRNCFTTKIVNNFIGSNIPNTQVLGSGRNGIAMSRCRSIVVGGDFSGSGNIVVGYDSSGISLDSCGKVTMMGNWIGHYFSALGSAGEQLFGIRLKNSDSCLVGSSNPDSVNIIGRNDSAGVAIYDTLSVDNVLKRNFIGRLTDSTTAIPNGVGILIENARRTIVGTDSANGNFISSNILQGVWIRGAKAVSNSVRFNAIYANGALDIDLGEPGVTPNDLGNMVVDIDADSGPNSLMNFPAGVTYAYDDDNVETVITGFLDTDKPEEDTIDIYATPAVNDSGYGGARIYIGQTVPDTMGFWRYERNFGPEQLPSIFISATATDKFGSTSEFSFVCGDPNGFGTVDNDEDGLCDDWEMDGIDYDGDRSTDLPLTSVANHRVKDIFVEIDWMYGGGFYGKPNSLLDVILAFRDAPVDNPHSSLDGIELHPTLSDSIPRKTWLGFNNDPPAPGTPALFSTFQEIKWGSPFNPCSNSPDGPFFGNNADRSSGNCAAILGARRLVYRYCVFGYNHIHKPGSSGVGDFPGDDFLITLGDWNDSEMFVSAGDPLIPTGNPFYDLGLNKAKTEVQCATFMHELGHTLGLDHGGNNRINYKPNYYSIMSYSRQLGDMIPSRKLDYSRDAESPLNESSLQEAFGMPGPPGEKTVFLQGRGPLDDTIIVRGTGTAPVDFDGLDKDNDGDFDNDVNVAANINGIDSGDPSTTGLQSLEGHDDWSNLVYQFRIGKDYRFGTSVGSSQGHYFTSEQSLAHAAAVDFDGDGFSNLSDNCPGVFNPDQADTNQNGTGDACEAFVPCGDLDASGQIDITDAVWLVNYIFAGGLPPKDSKGGDMDCSNQTDITDAVYLINYIFAGGPPPCAACR